MLQLSHSAMRNLYILVNGVNGINRINEVNKVNEVNGVNEVNKVNEVNSSMLCFAGRETLG